jgi:hypothetical protein
MSQTVGKPSELPESCVCVWGGWVSECNHVCNPFLAHWMECFALEKQMLLVV